MAKVTLYMTAVCPYCHRAEDLLSRKGVTDIDKIRVDLDPVLRQHMTQITGQRTVPQIYVGKHYVGGYVELAAAERSGELDALLMG